MHGVLALIDPGHGLHQVETLPPLSIGSVLHNAEIAPLLAASVLQGQKATLSLITPQNNFERDGNVHGTCRKCVQRPAF